MSLPQQCVMPPPLPLFSLQLSLDVVELDPSMLTIAKSWFGFMEDERMTVTVGNGLEFITEKASKSTS